MFRIVALSLSILFVSLFFCCTAVPLTPTFSHVLDLQDDLDNNSLEQAVSRSINYLHTAPEHSYIFAGKQLTTAHVRHSLATLLALLQQHLPSTQLTQSIENKFILLQAAGLADTPGTMLVTGYYQPVIHGSLVKKKPYLYPLYSPPDDLVILKSSTGKNQIGRYAGDQFTPYWTRAVIDTMGKARGHELVWLQDPLDVFFLQVQGSGVIRLTDGTERTVQYATGNGQPYHSIGKYMVQKGMISLETSSMQSIREYIDHHPEKRNEILFSNPSYVFFNWSAARGAIGSINQELTPGRSIAADQNYFPAGAPAFLITREPLLTPTGISGWKPVRRFVLVQDKGSAIKGSGRVDLFLGSGYRAGAKAGVMKETGKLFLLLLKEDMQ